MAGQQLNITRAITTLDGSASPYWQAGKDALDVLGYAGARFDFSLRVYVLNGSTPSVTAGLYTSMYNDDNNDNWIELDSFAAVTASNTSKIITVDGGVLRYVKWKLTTTNVTLCSFEVLGVAW